LLPDIDVQCLHDAVDARDDLQVRGLVPRPIERARQFRDA
jgi:hypothetical protein